MNEVCIVPTYQRSEMLVLTLEAIRAAEPEMRIEVFPDHGSSESEVCAKFNATEHLTWSHSYHGNSCNVMEAIKWASKLSSSSASTVFIIEDDAIIDPSFFDWCRAALAAHPELFAACGWRYSPDALPPSEGPDILIPWYLSVAAALPRRSVLSLAQHATLAYYSDMQHYCDSRFPLSSKRGTVHYEQDGLALRCAESQSRVCAWPRRPRTTHIGFHGYHMPSGSRLPGDLNDRVRLLRLIIRNPSLLSSLMSGGPMPEIDYCDTCGKPLVTQCPKSIVRCISCFHDGFPNRPITSESHYYLGPLLQATGTGVSP